MRAWFVPDLSRHMHADAIGSSEVFKCNTAQSG